MLMTYEIRNVSYRSFCSAGADGQMNENDVEKIVKNRLNGFHENLLTIHFTLQMFDEQLHLLHWKLKMIAFES